MKENPDHRDSDYRDNDHDREGPTEDQTMSDYDVGYKTPPKTTQFQKGQSGNPNGRPKGTKNLKTDLQEELVEPIRVTEGGKPVVLSKQRAVIKRTVELALRGNMVATNLLMKLMVSQIGMDEETDHPMPLTPQDRAILQRYVEQRVQIQSGQREGTNGEG